MTGDFDTTLTTERPRGPVRPVDALPEEIEDAQHLPEAEKTYPAWSTILTLIVLCALGVASMAFYFG